MLEQRYTIIEHRASVQTPAAGRLHFPVFFQRPCKPAMPKVHVSTVINAPRERVWGTVRSFHGRAAWTAGMTDSTSEDGKPADQIGAGRRLSMAGTKDQLRERL